MPISAVVQMVEGVDKLDTKNFNRQARVLKPQLGRPF